MSIVPESTAFMIANLNISHVGIAQRSQVPSGHAAMVVKSEIAPGWSLKLEACCFGSTCGGCCAFWHHREVQQRLGDAGAVEQLLCLLSSSSAQGLQQHGQDHQLPRECQQLEERVLQALLLLCCGCQVNVQRLLRSGGWELLMSGDTAGGSQQNLEHDALHDLHQHLQHTSSTPAECGESHHSLAVLI